MEMRQLRTFQVVASLLSFNKAAERLHCAQSTVSAQIQGLEEGLEVQLFDRLGHGITLTSAGEKLLEYAERVLALVEETRAEVRGSTPRGALRIRVPDTLATRVIPAVVARFTEAFPDVSLHFNSCSPNGVRDLDKGLVDLAFILTDAIRDIDLVSEAIAPAPMVVVAHPDHPLARLRSVTTELLVKERLLFTGSDCSYIKLILAMLAEQELVPQRLVELSNIAAIKACLAQGLGVSVLPRMIVDEELAAGQLVGLPWQGPSLNVSILMVWHTSKWQAPALRAFMDIAREQIRHLTLASRENRPLSDDKVAGIR